MTTIDSKAKVPLFTVLSAVFAVTIVVVPLVVWAVRLEDKADRGVVADKRTIRLEKGMIRIQERLKIEIPQEEKVDE